MIKSQAYWRLTQRQTLKFFIWKLKCEGFLGLRLRKREWSGHNVWHWSPVWHQHTSSASVLPVPTPCSPPEPPLTTAALLHSHVSVISFKTFSASWNTHLFSIWVFSPPSFLKFINPSLPSSNVIASRKSSWPCSSERINQALLRFKSTLLFLYYSIHPILVVTGTG